MILSYLQNNRWYKNIEIKQEMPRKTLRRKRGGDSQALMHHMLGVQHYVDPVAAAQQKAMMQQFQGLMPTIAANGKSAKMNPAATQAIGGIAGNIAQTFVKAGPNGKPKFTMVSNNVIKGRMHNWAGKLGFQPTAPIGTPAMGPGSGYVNTSNPSVRPESMTGPRLGFFQSSFGPQGPGGSSLFGPPSQASQNLAASSNIMSRFAAMAKKGGRKHRSTRRRR